MMDTEVGMAATGEDTAIIKMTIEEARGTIMTEVATEIDKEGMKIVIIGDIMTNAVVATIITMIGGVEGEEEITTEGIDNMTMVDMVEVAEEDMVVADMVTEEDEINQAVMQTSV